MSFSPDWALRCKWFILVSICVLFLTWKRSADCNEPPLPIQRGILGYPPKRGGAFISIHLVIISAKLNLSPLTLPVNSLPLPGGPEVPRSSASGRRVWAWRWPCIPTAACRRWASAHPEACRSGGGALWSQNTHVTCLPGCSFRRNQWTSQVDN